MMNLECENAGLSKPQIIDNGFMVKIIFWRPKNSMGTATGQQRDNSRTTVEEQQDNSRLTGEEQLRNISPSLKRLLIAIGEDWLTGQELRYKMGYKSKSTFWSNYLSPAMKKGLIALENEENPKSPTQRYGLTDLGHTILIAMQQ